MQLAAHAHIQCARRLVRARNTCVALIEDWNFALVLVYHGRLDINHEFVFISGENTHSMDLAFTKGSMGTDLDTS